MDYGIWAARPAGGAAAFRAGFATDSLSRFAGPVGGARAGHTGNRLC